MLSLASISTAFLLLFAKSCLAFTAPLPIHAANVARKVTCGPKSTDIERFTIATTAIARRRIHSLQIVQMTSNPAGEEAASIVKQQAPKFLRTLNASTKWLVTLGNTIGVWSRPHKFHGPYIVVGSIAAVYFTDVLKKLINQSRPENSPFADPGMPSSHSLVSFFAAVGWMSALGSYGGNIGTIALLASAATVAILRVVCGYHSVAQVAVGAALGSALGQGWVVLGNILHLSNPRLLLIAAWTAYLSGSALFITTNMSTWVHRDKHL